MRKNISIFAITAAILLIAGYVVFSLLKKSEEPISIERQNVIFPVDNAALGKAGTAKPRIEVRPNGLKIEVLKEGIGTGAENGKTVSVHYAGTLLNGTKFDSSRDRGTPFSFRLGAGMVIKGWDEGLLGMKVGEMRKITIPPELGYGNRGAGNVIPPNATLIFEIELLTIQ